MNRVEVIEEFTLKEFKKIKNLVRFNPDKNEDGRLYIKDTFECDDKMKDYLTGNNPLNKKVIEVIKTTSDSKAEKEEKPKKATKKTKTSVE